MNFIGRQSKMKKKEVVIHTINIYVCCTFLRGAVGARILPWFKSKLDRLMEEKLGEGC